MNKIMTFGIVADNREDETIIEEEQASLEIEPHVQELLRMPFEKRSSFKP